MPNGKVWRGLAISSLTIAAIAISGMIIFYFNNSTTVVLLVRHGDRDNAPLCTDALGGPQLNATGNTRATELAHVGEDAGIQAIYTSEFCRTKQTVQPIQNLTGLAPVEVNQYDAGTHTVPDVADLVNRLNTTNVGQTVLVAGHSDTVPLIIDQLGGGTTSFGGSEFDNFYVVTIFRWWFIKRVKVVRLKYGAVT